MNAFTQEDIDFLVAEKINGQTATLPSSAAYVRNLDEHVVTQYENIYRRVIDAKLSLCRWCSAEVFNVVKKVHLAFQEYFTYAGDPVTAPDVEHTITEEDLENNPDLVGHVEVGETVTFTDAEPTEEQGDEQPEPPAASAKKSRAKKS